MAEPKKEKNLQEPSETVEPEKAKTIRVYHSTFNQSGKCAEIADTEQDREIWKRNGYSTVKPEPPTVPKK